MYVFNLLSFYLSEMSDVNLPESATKEVNIKRDRENMYTFSIVGLGLISLVQMDWFQTKINSATLLLRI